MKVAVLSVADQRGMAPALLYTEYFEKKNISYDVICINRFGSANSIFGGRIYAYSERINNNDSKVKKLIAFKKFEKYALKIINKNSYDFIVVWNENTMTLFSRFLLNTKIPYSINIRDFDYVHAGFIGKIQKKVMNKAALVTIPTLKVPNFLSHIKFIPFISQAPETLKNVSKKEEKHSNPIRFSYIGNLRDPKPAIRIIDALKNDNRFLVQYIGKGSEQLSEYIKKNRIKNVRLVGAFDNTEIGKYLNITDIMNVYYDKSEGGGYVEYGFQPVKMGYAVKLNIPVVVSSTFSTVASNVKKYNLGFVLDDSKLSSFGDDLYFWYMHLKFHEIINGNAEYNRYIESINNKFYEKCSSVFSNQERY